MTSASRARCAWTVVFALASLSFAGAGLSHVVRGLDPAPDDGTPLRHLVFVVIDLAAAVGLLVRPRWFALPFALLVLQQLHGHGGKALAALRAGAAPAAVDAAVAVFMPVVLALLVIEARRAPATPPAATDPAPGS